MHCKKSLANGKDYTAITSGIGEALLKPIPFGTYDLKADVPGFLPYFQKDYKVKRGKINKVDVVLVRA